MSDRSRTRIASALALSLLPGALALRWLAFRAPDSTERLYGEGIYPIVARVLGTASGAVPISVAEAAAVIVGVAGIVVALMIGRRALPRLRSTEPKRFIRGLLYGAWVLAGGVMMVFLLLWGLNYARPPLATRLGLDTSRISTDEVLALGRQTATTAAALHHELGQPATAPTVRPTSLGRLNRAIDEGLQRLDLPGDIGGPSPAAKPLLVSGLLARLGISGIFIPFTGEPSYNALVPDVSLPVVIAHEKAHQRGVTNEGEANLVGALACLASEDPYVRYAGALYVASRLIGAAARYRPDDARLAWQELGPGPLADLEAERAFWLRYQGPAREVASRVNDAYLRSNRVPDGIESYAQVVGLLVGAHRAGRLDQVPTEGEP